MSTFPNRPKVANLSRQIQHNGSRADLCSLARVSRPACVAALPLIYHSIEFTIGLGASLRKLNLLLRSLWTNPRLRSFVFKLTVGFLRIGEVDTPFAIKLRQLRPILNEGLVKLLTGLRNLTEIR